TDRIGGESERDIVDFHMDHPIQSYSTRVRLTSGTHLPKWIAAVPATTLRIPTVALTRISHDGIILRAASAENTFTSMIRGGSALLSRRQTVNWTPMAAIRLCTSQCPIRRRCYSLVADSADNPQISAA